MKTVIGGDGSNTTAAVQAWLMAGSEFRFANLVLIGEPEDPMAKWLTDWESGLSWPVWGTFKAAVMKCGPVGTKIGLDITTMSLEWSPPVTPLTASIATASPYQLAQAGYYDNMKVRNWTAFMPVPGDAAFVHNGDANTYGCCERFGGRISKTVVERGKITFTVTCFLNATDTMVPPNVIELTNVLAGYAGATPPPGDSVVPVFVAEAGSTQTKLVLTELTPTANKVYANNVLQNGFVVFLGGAGATLQGQWSAILGNEDYEGSPTQNEIILYTPLQFPPVPGVDTCYISGSFPVTGGASFPFAPAPSTAP